MSLVCHECSIDLEPSKELPGREGTMVHPVVLALKYVVLKDGNIAYKADYMWSDDNRSLCFECIEKKLPEERKHLLEKIYECYEEETKYRKIEDAQKGKWIQWGSGPSPYSIFNQKYKALEQNCLFCGDKLKKGLPYFRPLVIDRVESSKHLSACQSYSWSNLERGMTGFNICFEDFKKNFPRCFHALSQDLFDGKKQAHTLKPNTIYLPKGYREAMEGGKQNLDEIIGADEEFVVFTKKK